MIFQATWEAVLDGRKTETRRIVKSSDDMPCGDYVHCYHGDGFCKLANNPNEPAVMPGTSGIECAHHGVDYGCEGQLKTITYVWDCCAERLKWEVGRDYAVQPGRGQKAIGRIRLLEIRQERLQDIDEAGAEAEGVALQAWAADSYHQFPRTAGYAHLWDSIHTNRGERWDDNPTVWVLRFELVEDTK
jgi:hypothetical protein